MILPLKILKKKYKAGALQLVIAIALLFFLLTGAFLIRKGLNEQFLSWGQIDEQLQLNIKSAVTLIENSIIQSEDSFSLSLFPEINDSTSIKITQWGLFDIGTIHSRIQGRPRESVILLGRDLESRTDLPSLYFSDPNRYLSISGDTYLGENTYLPKYGIRKASINGIGYSREQLVFGEQLKADSNLPQLFQQHINRINQYILDNNEETYSYSDTENLMSNMQQSFFQNTIYIESDEDLNLSGTNLSGNIILKTLGNIRIDENSQIDNCILIAKKIIIERDFIGRGQFFATDSILVETNSSLLMPSILAVINQTDSCLIQLDDNVSFSGNIIMQTESKELLSSLIINDDCKLIGQVYCNGYCDFQGVLFGSLYTKGFISITENSFNQNLLLDACIDISRMPDEFSGINLLNNDTHLKYIETLF